MAMPRSKFSISNSDQRVFRRFSVVVVIVFATVVAAAVVAVAAAVVGIAAAVVGIAAAAAAAVVVIAAVVVAAADSVPAGTSAFSCLVVLVLVSVFFLFLPAALGCSLFVSGLPKALAGRATYNAVFFRPRLELYSISSEAAFFISLDVNIAETGTSTKSSFSSSSSSSSSSLLLRGIIRVGKTVMRSNAVVT